MIEEAEQIIAEIKDIRNQYDREVSSKGKPWPKSIQSRIMRLIELGYSMKSISIDSGVPYYSILNWRHRDRKKAEVSRFRELVITPVSSGTATVAASCPSSFKTATVTVTTPGGFRIEALEACDVIKILRSMNLGA